MAGCRDEPTCVGIALNLASSRPASASAADVAAAQRQDGFVNRWFLDPLLLGGYPDDMLQWFARHAGSWAVLDEDMPTIATPMDFLGINVYHPEWVHAGGSTPLWLEPAPAPPPHSPLGWQIDPQNPAGHPRPPGVAAPIWITENGISDDATAPLEQRLEDDGRVAYLAAHLEALGAALADGVDVRRYFVWSLLDSFEWELGYGAAFGLIRVDAATQERAPKRSAHWYRDFIARARSDQHG